MDQKEKLDFDTILKQRERLETMRYIAHALLEFCIIMINMLDCHQKLK